MISIVFSEGPLAGDRLDVVGETTVGRMGCDVVLNDRQVSRRHLALRPADGELRVEDLGSTNGTLVNGERIAGATTIREGDVVNLGISEFIVHVPTPREASAPHPAPAVSAAAPQPAGRLPGSFWVATGLVEIAVILVATALLGYYGLR